MVDINFSEFSLNDLLNLRKNMPKLIIQKVLAENRLLISSKEKTMFDSLDYRDRTGAIRSYKYRLSITFGVDTALISDQDIIKHFKERVVG